ncbi:MAG TPA: OsmC family protein [Gammaproteobacteria bacterium]|nr:OsmC family protein [Gammaproteobacteria bacterium]
MPDHSTHHYAATCHWQGSTASGYENYDRSHTVTVSPVAQPLSMSSDPAFYGKPEQLNPEQLLLMAASSCQMLSFLAIAARSRLDVVEYQDQAEAFMPMDDRPVRITRIVLRPRVVVRGEADEERVRQCLHKGHEHCFIANSLKTSMEIVPEIIFRPS